jgi:5-methylcytosine-specific restriction endonuclease McrA
MPWDKSRYPADWDAIREAMLRRAEGQCQCVGSCGLHRTHPGPRRCTERQHTPAQWARGRIVLTTAHLCRCEPPCGTLEHLAMMCQRCHLRTDMALHKEHAAATRRKAKEALGQLPLGFLR